MGSITLNTGSGGTGSFCVNADASPDMGVTIKAGSAYVQATPASQNSQVLRVRAAADYTAYTINANATGSTKYDWIYLKIDATLANNPIADASTTASFITSRSTSNTSDTGTPPTYGLVLAIVTVANGASSITNSNIIDQRALAVTTQTNYTNYFALYNFIESGCVWTADSAGSTLNASMTSGAVWISGKRLTVGAVSARAFTASKDTYVDFRDAGNGTATIIYTEATNNAASPALTGLRNAILVTGASSIAAATSVNQGQETMVLPIASSIPYAVTDSLGNLICPRDPQRKILGYRQILSSATATTIAQIVGLTCPVIVPTGRKIKINLYSSEVYCDTINKVSHATIWDGVVNSGTQLQEGVNNNQVAANGMPMNVQVITTPATASKTYNAGLMSSGNTTTFVAAATAPAYIKVELV